MDGKQSDEGRESGVETLPAVDKHGSHVRHLGG